MTARRTLFSPLILTSAVLMAAGCASFLPPPAETREFALTPVAPQSGAAPLPALNLTVAIDAPYTGNRLLVRDLDGEFRPFAGGRWAAPLKALLEASWGFSLERAGVAELVQSGAVRGGHYPLLALQVREFFAAAGQGRAEIHLSLVAAYQAGRDTPPAVRTFTSHRPAELDDIAALAAAFDAANQALVSEALGWLKEMNPG